MKLNTDILLSYDLLVNPIPFLLTLCCYPKKNIFVKQLDLLTVIEELKTLLKLNQERDKEYVFSTEVHKAMLQSEIDGMVRPIINIEKLPNVSEIKSIVIDSCPSILFEKIRKYSLEGDLPTKFLCSLWILKEMLQTNVIKILQEKPEYITFENKNNIPTKLYMDLLDDKLEYYPFLPRYEYQYRSRRFLLQTGLCEKMQIATTLDQLSDWLNKNGLSLFSIEKSSGEVYEETISYDPSAFFLEDAVKLIKNEADYPLIEKIVKTQKTIEECELLHSQLKTDLVLTILSLHPLGSIINVFSWITKLFRYISVKRK